MKVSPLLPSKDLSPTSHSSHPSHPSHSSPKYAWSVFYPMQAFSEKVENKNTNNNTDVTEIKTEKDKNKKLRISW